MQFDHEQLAVDRASVRSVAWACETAQGQTILIPIATMLTKLEQRGHEVRENLGRYDALDNDNDNDDNDNDNDNDDDDNDNDNDNDKASKAFRDGLVQRIGEPFLKRGGNERK